jgi:hypothetical protein
VHTEATAISGIRDPHHIGRDDSARFLSKLEREGSHLLNRARHAGIEIAHLDRFVRWKVENPQCELRACGGREGITEHLEARQWLEDPSGPRTAGREFDGTD